MKSTKITITNQAGLSSQPVCSFIQEANEFKSKLQIEHNDQRVNAKSLLGILSLNITMGTTITLLADGPDEDEALTSLADVLSKL